MSDLLQSLTDLWHRLAADPTTQTHALLGGILVALGTLAVRRKAKRERISVDVSEGTEVSIHLDRSREK